MRKYALAALVAAISCFWACGQSLTDTVNGIKMYKKVTKTDRSHPAHKMFGAHGDICEVEYTDEYKKYLQQMQAGAHHREAPGENLSDAAGQNARAALAPWVNPVLVGRTAGITIELDTVNKKTIVTFPADNSNTMWWLLAQCTSPADRTFAAQNTYMDEQIHWISADGQTATDLTVSNVLLDKATGCGGGYMEQILAADPSLKGTWEFKMMFLHTTTGTGRPNFIPVHDYRNELYDLVVVVP